ncbi:hypothetical protein LTR10_013257 [Elasticomyces elasticus]|uniref:AB hydrolase-1 domain-containing protein n=1 Tax=Exophiala sideris TaxID=1016849 RepID=A0ABR0J4X6_9EURO|nr:hypothetical protein LTR10_013257 [Elasticomyces elasticus]KAK5027514.1 hypothetical protein LTS07_007116 [Exophiala sideris]KAK5034781.1 hypothetical protein LTR13_005963 [Exophiala sideris]KAK5056481.1 hypothetical protein LTR69_008022 [Exophiala sideris]KAK5181027.1 hypothetical protein LTR44_006358 [Eurotiomycetes sp. CCFEE 6388]
MAYWSRLADAKVEWNYVVAGTCLFAAGALVRSLFVKPPASYIYTSPRTTLLPKLSDEERSQLPYPPDVLPGARDVDSPYGSIRAYEFGPEDGRKVLLVHGISTPAIALLPVANALAENGCRVMLFDLFGRGYSDNARDIKHDMRLFTSQILLVLASSPLSWTGKDSGKFALVGYSLGGGIATTFASYFPNLVDSLILFAPAGLVRPHHISRQTRILYSEGIIPQPILHRLVKQRLRTPIAAQPKKPNSSRKVDATEAVGAEVNIESNSQAPLSKDHPNASVEAAIYHQLDHHPGFVPAFMSSIRYGPIRDQHDRWRVVGERLSQQNKENGTEKKVLIVLGSTDPIIIKQEVRDDATEALSGNVEFTVLDAAHDVAVVKGPEIASAILDFWKRTD